MTKLLRYARKIDWLLVVVIVALTVLQVYCTMTLMDYIAGITKAITFLDYHNNPVKIVEMIATMSSASGTPLPDSVLTSLTAQATADPSQFWATMTTMASALPEGSGAESILSIANATSGDIWWNAGMMVLCSTGMVLVQVVISVFAAFIASHLATTIRKEVNDKISSFSLAEINRFSTASLVTRATNDIQIYQMTILLTLRMFFAAPITAIWAVCKIQAVSWELMLPTAVGVVLLIIGLVLLITMVMPKFKSQQKLLDGLNGITRENLNGIRVVRAYNAEGYQKQKFEKANDELTKVQLFTGRGMALLSPYITIIMNGISIAVYWIGAILINRPESTLTYAQLLSFMMLSTQIVMAFMMLLFMFFMIPRATVCAKRINEVLDSKNTILDPEEETLTSETGHLVFRNVSFTYPDATEPVVSELNFEVNQGETLALIGATGSGKSTIVNLAARLYDVTEGEVLIDGVDVRKLKQSTLRKKIGFVPQKGLLFRGSVRSNIAFGNPDMSMDEVLRAAKIAEADSFIQEMQDGYDAPIAQGGSNVSGGQRQRLCIARAVALHPEFIIFDDSFSALDFKTDRKVRDNLKEAEKEATKVIVAQRIGTIMDADHIVVLSDGKMVGYGTHRELLENCPTYREIALSQLTKEELGL